MTLNHDKECDIKRGQACSCGTDEMVEEFSPPWTNDLKLILDGDHAWPELRGKKLVHVTHGIQVAALKAGTKEGRPSVAIRIDLPDGTVVIAETTLRLFKVAAAALEAKYKGDL